MALHVVSGRHLSTAVVVSSTVGACPKFIFWCLRWLLIRLACLRPCVPQELFFEKFMTLLADNQRATFAGSMASAWLSLRLQVWDPMALVLKPSSTNR